MGITENQEVIGNENLETPEVKKSRGRPKGTIKPETVEAKRQYAHRQLEKLEARKEKLTVELELVYDKIHCYKQDIA